MNFFNETLMKYDFVINKKNQTILYWNLRLEKNFKFYKSVFKYIIYKQFLDLKENV